MTPMNRRCNHPDHKGKRYLPVSKFHKRGKKKGVQQYNTICKDCVNRDNRAKYVPGGKSGGLTPEEKNAYSRARSRATTRLTKIVPDLYRQCLDYELLKEPGWPEHRKRRLLERQRDR